MLVMLVRHAKAFDRDLSAWPDDLRRPLTAAGREAFARLAKRLRRLAPEVDQVIASPATRTWQTARVLHERAEWPEPVRSEALLPDDDGDGVARHAALLPSLAGSNAIAMVGHEPTLGAFASWLLCGDAMGIRISVRKGAVIGIELPTATLASAAGQGALAWMVTPRVAARAGRRK